MPSRETKAGTRVPYKCLCGCGESLPPLVDDALDSGRIFASDACASEWAQRDAANQFDRGELNWCDVCGQSFYWDGGHNACPHCAGQTYLVRLTLDVPVKAKAPEEAIETVRTLVHGAADNWLACPSVVDPVVVVDASLAALSEET